MQPLSSAQREQLLAQPAVRELLSDPVVVRA
jgi:hypothetical protein